MKRTSTAITLDEEEIAMLIDFHEQCVNDALESGEHDEVERRRYRVGIYKQLLKEAA